jgi:hypothetical protein
VGALLWRGGGVQRAGRGFGKEKGRASKSGMKHAAFLFSVFAALALWSNAGAQNVPRSAVCTAENSTRASAAELAADPGKWMGQCVAVEGIYLAERVYADADAIYGVTDHSVGGFVDGLSETIGAVRGEFVGRVSDCAVAEEVLLTAQLRAPGISLHERVLGCTRDTGPFLMFMSHGALEPAGLQRRLPGAKGGDLELAPLDWEHLGAVTQKADGFAAAMREGDAAALAALLGDGYRAQLLLGDNASALSFLKDGSGPLTVFRERGNREDEVAAEACWCKARACGRVWPIDSRDADNDGARPYACLRVEGVKRDGAWRYRLDASHDAAGLPEP